MGVNKVKYGENVVLDISSDTVTADKLLQGYTAHDNTGTLITGTATGGGTGAISVVDTTDTHGGTIRTITAVDISDTTAQAGDVAQGKYFYTADGTKTAGTSSGGGGTAIIQSLSVTQNGTYTAPSGVDGYSPVTVNVSGGSSSWELLGSNEFTVNTSSTSQTNVGSVSCGSSVWTKDKIIYVRVRDKAGKRAGYFYGSDVFFINANEANNTASSSVTNFNLGARAIIRYSSSNQWGISSGTGYGVWAVGVYSDGHVTIYARYNSTNSLTIDGTYLVQVYALDYPDGISPFDA